MQNLKPLASLYSWAGQFESYHVENPKDGFSRDVAQILVIIKTQVQLCTANRAQFRALIPREVYFSSIQGDSLVLILHFAVQYMSRLMTKPTKWLCTKRRLRSAWTSTQSDQSLRCALIWEAKGPMFLQADSEDSDQPGRMPRLIWVFDGRTCLFVGFAWGSSYTKHFNGSPRSKWGEMNSSYWVARQLLPSRTPRSA